MSLKIAFIIPTKDRLHDLNRLLDSIEEQDVIPDQIIIVDASSSPNQELHSTHTRLSIYYKHVSKPSLTGQRNIGIGMLDGDIGLVCFLDDDIILSKDALRNMINFWDGASNDTGGAVFNIINEKLPSGMVHFKRIFLSGCKERGSVLSSGFNTLICPADETRNVQWLHGGATVWKKEIFRDYLFDEWFEGTGLCEDLDFSFRVGKKYKLFVVSDANVEHLTDNVGRRDNYQFGITQVRNRLYFVRKNSEFSKVLCFWACLGQWLENLFRALFSWNCSYWQRALGNIAGFKYFFMKFH